MDKEGAMARLPKAYEDFKKAYPKVWQDYDRLGAAVHDSGPLDKKNRELIKLAMAIGARLGRRRAFTHPKGARGWRQC